MASQQAWNDVEALKGLIAGLDAEIAGTIKGYLHNINVLFLEIAADPIRVAEAVALADTHPVANATYLNTQVGEALALREWLITNGYIVD